MRKIKISMDGKNTIHCLHHPLSKNKHLEIQWGRFDEDDTNIFSFDSSWRTKGDHAGFESHAEVLRWHLRLAIYDCRHWDDEKDRWEKDEENYENSSN